MKKLLLAALLALTAPTFAQSPALSNVAKLNTLLSVADPAYAGGAKGDGTTDDAAAVQAAINAMPAGSTLLFQPGKTYLIGAAGLNITSKSKLTLNCQGAKIKFNGVPTQSMPAAGVEQILIASSTRITITNCEIDGNSKAANVIGMNLCTECVISNNEIYGGNLSAHIMALGGTRNAIRNNIVRNGVGVTRGMWLGNYQVNGLENDIEVSGNIVRNNPASGIGVFSTGGRVFGNHSESNAGAGIVFGGANGFAVTKLIIDGNLARGNLFHGIQSDVVYTTLADVPTGIVISNNIVEQNAASGIYAVFLRFSSITGNIARDNNFDGVGTADGIQTEESDGLVISGNQAYDTRVGGARTQSDGIRVVTGSAINNIKNIVIVGNNVFNNTAQGIDIQSVAGVQTIDGVTITGNRSSGNGGYGIAIAEATAGNITNVVISGNIALGNTTLDIRADPVSVAFGQNTYSTESNVAIKDFTNADTTPSVAGGRRNWRFNNAGATNVTNFTNGTNGQDLVIRSANANTTLICCTLILKGAVNTTIPSDSYITLRREGTVWREVSRGY